MEIGRFAQLRKLSRVKRRSGYRTERARQASARLIAVTTKSRCKIQADLGRLNLAVDRKIDSIFDLDDAMKVQTKDNRIVAIGKKLKNYNAVDTGIFLCPEITFEYLRRTLKEGDCSLADGVRLMAADGKALAIDIGEAWWQDVDTPEMLARAEQEAERLSGSVQSAGGTTD